MNKKIMNLFTSGYEPNINMIIDNLNNLSLNYVGNKRKILGWIYECLRNENINLEEYNVLDLCSGCGIFARFCKNIGCQIWVMNIS